MAVTVFSESADEIRLQQRSIVELSDGTLIVMIDHELPSTNDSHLEFYYSDDDGATWTDTTDDITDVRVSANAAHAYKAAMRVADDDSIWVAYTEDSDDIKGVRGTFSAGRITWDSGYTYDPGNQAFGVDACVFPIGTDYYLASVYQTAIADTELTIMKRTSGGTWSLQQHLVMDGTAYDNTTIDFRHTGDGLTVASSSPDLFVGMGDNDPFFEKVTYSAGPTWSTGTKRTIDSAGGMVGDANVRGMTSVFDGSDFVMVALNTGATPYVDVWKRDAGDTTTTAITGNTAMRSTAFQPGIFTDGTDLWLFGIDSNSDPVWEKYDGSWDGSLTVVEAATATQVNVHPFKVGDTIHCVWIDTSTWDVMYEGVTGQLNTPPTAPTWTTTAGAYDIGASLLIDWVFNDPDTGSGDTQSAYEVRRSDDAEATWEYWTGTAWQASSDATTKETGTSSQLTFSASWGTTTPTDYRYQVRTYDAADAGPSPWSSSLVITPSEPDTTTITAPTPTGTPTVGATATVTWTTGATQTRYRVVVSDTSSTSDMDAGTLEFDTGWITDNAQTISNASFPTNSVTRYVRVQTENVDALKSNIDEVDVSVSYTPPATPTLVADDGTANAGNPVGAITVTCTDPGTGSTVDYHSIYRRVSGDTGDGIRMATNVAVDGSWVDYTVAAGTTYEYLVRSVGTNDSTADSAWTA